MVTDSPPNAAFNPKDMGKKKRGNRNAKLKQCKLDARREQWLSWSKNRELKEEENETQAKRMSAQNEQRQMSDKLEDRKGRDIVTDHLIHRDNHDSDYESQGNSPSSMTESVLSGNDSGTNFTGSSSCSSSTTSCSAECCLGSLTEEEVGGDDEDDDDDCLDNWEAMADALAADDKQESPPAVNELGTRIDSCCENTNGLGLDLGDSKPVTGTQGNSRAWRPDDAFRPLSLPNLSMNPSFPSSNCHCHGGFPLANPAPSLCPICYEDFDITDASFLPCLCGFRLCLFCYKRILEEDGRCPGCRKSYEKNPVETEASVNG